MRINKNKPNLRGRKKMVLRGMFLAVKMFIKKLERSHTCDLTAHFKVPQEKNQTHPKVDVR